MQVLTFPEFQVIETDFRDTPAIARVFVKDWENEKELAKLKNKLPEFFIDHDGKAQGEEAMRVIRIGKARANDFIHDDFVDPKDRMTHFPKLYKETANEK